MGNVSVRNKTSCDYLIIGSGAIGLATGIALLQNNPALKVVIVDKENALASHASGRNSGVIHAGFYYSPDSLKARFCRDGNQELTKLARKYEIPVREVGKVVVAKNEGENSRLDLLSSRGQLNGVELELLEAKHLEKYEPLARTYNRFIWSPKTAISHPKEIVQALKFEFENLGGQVHLNTKVELTLNKSEVVDSSNNYNATHFINSAGAHADRLAKKIGVGTEYSIIPFLGVYRATDLNKLPLQRLVYPVPHPVNPFLGVHFTLTMDSKVKIGPTAIPVWGREQYEFGESWSLKDSMQISKALRSLIKGDTHDLRSIFLSEVPKLLENTLVKEASGLVAEVQKVPQWQKRPPGIRAQLVHLPSGKLEQDFLIKKFHNSTHILNAVSPGWTSAIPFGRYVANLIINGNS